jgi:hypothetical protein
MLKAINVRARKTMLVEKKLSVKLYIAPSVISPISMPIKLSSMENDYQNSG